MAATSRAAQGSVVRRGSKTMRPPMSRPQSVRAQSHSSVPVGNSRPGVVSPANSVTSTAASTRARSPGGTRVGMKRKEREFEHGVLDETNIHVAVRCRGRNQREVKENSVVALSTNGVKGTTVELSMGPHSLSNKTYSFDKVFSPAADQAMIYDEVVTPILDEMLEGFNCTIFAYGQTGTGKTFTMSGDMSDTYGLLSDSAGIIPRVLQSLFAKLEAQEKENTVKCSFIELYNEELRDLLSVDDGTKLKLYEDTNKKGHAATLVQGMEESHIRNAEEGVKLLRHGSHKRQVAATKCNDLSSRSHTVFTVTSYTKCTTDTGEDYVSVGKLNLVDLAGSENIQRSGAENKRAAEAGLINKSLLTLGRVINALVEKGSHIPYRESKLTRLLQDSLGGRTKTCIIATVSPARSNLEETISTLDYAFRAKNIRNKPQVNQAISKKTLLREFTNEIEKLKSELIATRQRNGVYLANDAYEEMTQQNESRRILTEEQAAKIETMEANLRNKVQELFTLTASFNTAKKDHDGTRANLEDIKGVLEKTEFVLETTRQSLEEETVVREAHEQTEAKFGRFGSELLSAVNKSVSDVGGLHSKLRRKSDLHAANRSQWRSSQAQISDVTRLVEMRLDELKDEQQRLIGSMSSKVEGYVGKELESIEQSRIFLEEKLASFNQSEGDVFNQTSKSKDDMNAVLEEIKTLREEVKQKVGDGLSGLSTAAARISADVLGELEGSHEQLHTCFSTLGKEFKGLFDHLLERLKEQEEGAEILRRDLERANERLVQENRASSGRLETVLAEEREQSAKDRAALLRQISGLIEASGEAQDRRVTSKIQAVQAEIADSQMSFEATKREHDDLMDEWQTKEKEFAQEVVQSRDQIKRKLQQDWQDTNERNASIQESTKSIHEETVRIVEAQMEELGAQMQALDDFVKRARAQNEQHHDAHTTSLGQLATNVRESYGNFESRVDSGSSRVKELGKEVQDGFSGIEASLKPIDIDARQPLAELRTNVTGQTVKEYVPTGDTPEKHDYTFPTSLPRTESREVLLSRKRKLEEGSTTPTQEPPGLSRSPSKTMVFTDGASEDITEPTLNKTLRAVSGLREVNPNVAANENHTAPLAALAPLAPPPLKKQHTYSGRSSHRSARHAVDNGAHTVTGGKLMIRPEGRENAINFSASLGRNEKHVGVRGNDRPPALNTRRRTRQSPQ